MKLRVVDWVDYDDDFEDGNISCWAARNAIIDDIRAHGYMFSGWAHQEGYRGVPLLNDGKAYRYSQRGWGDVMAEAHEKKGSMGYASYAFMMDASLETRPDDRPKFKGEFESDLAQTFEIETSRENFERAQREGKTVFEDYDALRYVYCGDTLILRANGDSETFCVTDVRRTRDESAKGEDKFILTVWVAKLQ